MDVEAHGNDPDRVIGGVRDWLNSGRGDRPPLPGSAAIVADDAELEEMAAGIIARLRLGHFDTLSHPDFLYVVEAAPPMIEAARKL